MLIQPNENPAGNIKTPLQLILWLGGLAFLAGLIILAFSGWFARYLQDDYCFDFLLKRRGFWNAQVFTFINEVTFNGNRFSTNLVMGALAQIGLLSARLLPAFLVSAWLAAMVWLLRGLNWLLKWHWPSAFQFFTSVSIVFFSLVQAPNLYQVLFWRPAAVTYLLPLVSLTFLFALVIHLVRNEKSPIISFLLCSLLAFWVGGHSETAALFLFGSLTIIMLWLNISRTLDGYLGRNINRLALAVLIGSLLSILVLVLSPSARLRQSALFPQPPHLMEMLRISLDGMRQFLLATFYRQTLPSLLGMLIFFFSGFLLAHFSPKTMGLRKSPLFKYLLILLLALFFLLFCITLPSAYASSSVPEERVLLWARSITVVALMSLSIVMGDWVGRYVFNPARRRLLMALGYSLACIILIFIILVPAQVKFQPAYPEIRDWLIQDPVRLGGLIFLFFLLLWMAGRIKLEKRYIEEWIPFLLLVLIFSMCLMSLPQLFNEVTAYQLRAELWDWRDARIHTAILRGNYEIELPALDSIAGITELQANPDHWVNNCAELFYGMKSISAVPPVLTAVPAEN